MLTADELRFFIRNGYFVRRGALDPDLCQQAVAVGWKRLDAMGFPRSPERWKRDRSIRKCRGIVKLRGDICSDRTLISVLPRNAEVQSIAAQLLGDDCVSTGVRGLYPTFPIPRWMSFPFEPHIEVHPLRLFFVGYLDRVSAAGGALLVWPGSHIEMYQSFDSKLGYIPNAAFTKHYDYYDPRVPVELTAEAGDVIVLHHRVLHSGSNNNGNSIRFAMFADFLMQQDLLALNAAPGQDMWEDWPESVRETAGTMAADEGGPIGSRYSWWRDLQIRTVNFARKCVGLPAGSQYSSNTGT